MRRVSKSASQASPAGSANDATPTRLVFADDHPLVLDGLVQLFAREPGFQIVGTATTGDDALSLVRNYHPDVLVLDLRMPGKDGLAVLRELSRDPRPTHVVVLTAVESEEVADAIRLGARGLVLKDMAPRLLVQCVKAVAAGGRWLERKHAVMAIDRLLGRESCLQDLANTLTPRELEVAQMIASGLHNKTIADRLSIGEGTAKLHLHHIYRKLNVDGRVGLVRYLQHHGYS
jgi:two-component system, NarL family, nitrate/nitrite response regulator NarL